ncbi:NADH:flavin oxidoreductase [Vibrio porteresiae]|uniref:NADH:flavin oxidoreductase n=1 Tax=Vibrio porteresiae DSM 19223 TaxID=1123496 RepID=A0ABZ0QJI5_9VIBR|nr:NADH:flavin oxidoreductase [Vibrio porteresiae]WPC75862.1 NADH:flavin oxidoreductase [Vibrio porteresiae DSM 19223]
MKSLPSSLLFQPYQLKNLNLKNRIVMAPMTRNFAIQGVVTDDISQYYRRRAENDVGLILSEATIVDRPAAHNDPRVPQFYGQQALAGWKHVIDSVHAVGGRMGPQLWHVGAVSGAAPGTAPPHDVESPSGLSAIESRHTPAGRAMSDEDIADTISAFAKAAASAKELGFDVVEVHGAHGYLLDQFFWSETNKRTDRYGGLSLRDRTTFAVELTKAMRESVGMDFPLIFRISQFKTFHYTTKLAHTPDELASWLQPLADAGVDVFDCSMRRFWEPEFPEIDGAKGLNLAGWAKEITGKTTIAVGSVGLSGDVIGALFDGEASQTESLDELIRRMENKEFDLIAIGRALLNDPYWAKKVKEGDYKSLRDFDPISMAKLI